MFSSVGTASTDLFFHKIFGLNVPLSFALQLAVLCACVLTSFPSQGFYEQSPPRYISYDAELRAVAPVQPVGVPPDYELSAVELDLETPELPDREASVELISSDVDQLQLSLEIEKER